MTDNLVEKSAMCKILDDLDYDAFKAMQAQWLKKGRMLWFTYGNLSKDQAKQIVDQAVQLAAFEPIAKEELSSVRIVDLSA